MAAVCREEISNSRGSWVIYEALSALFWGLQRVAFLAETGSQNA